MKPSQLISRENIDDAYDEIHADMDFAYKRAKVLADMLGIPVHEHPEVTGTILGLVRGSVERIQAELQEHAEALTIQNATIVDLGNENQRLKAAISWALGEGDSDFGDHKPKDATVYWWRKELRQRADTDPMICESCEKPIVGAVVPYDDANICQQCHTELTSDSNLPNEQPAENFAPVSSGLVMPFRIYGAGIYSLRQPRYETAKEAHDDLWRYARSLDQSPLLFTVYEDLPDGSHRLT